MCIKKIGKIIIIATTTIINNNNNNIVGPWEGLNRWIEMPNPA